MIKIYKSLAVLLLSGLMFLSCSQQNSTNETQSSKDTTAIPEKQADLQMNKDSLNNRIISDVYAEVIKRKVALTAEALSTIGETQNLLLEVKNGKREDAIEKAKTLIGHLEVLLAKDPALSMIPVDVNYRKNELITDIETVRSIVADAQEAMDEGYYQEASDLLASLKSEMEINTYLIPAATYPAAIRDAVIFLEDSNVVMAEKVLQAVLNTIVVEKTILPLPVLKAEQMIIEAANIDAANHDNSEQVINLLKNADYQLKLAEEMGYGKKDKDFATLNEAIKVLEESVSNKENSTSKFDSLKAKIKEFKERLFPIGKK